MRFLGSDLRTEGLLHTRVERSGLEEHKGARLAMSALCIDAWEENMRLLTRTTSNNVDFDGECTYAVIDISESCAVCILSRRELLQMVKAKDSCIHTLKFWDCSAVYYAGLKDLLKLTFDDCAEEKLEEILQDGHNVLLREDVELPEESQRTECDQLVIYDTCFYWQCYPKHTSLTITTETIEYGELIK